MERYYNKSRSGSSRTVNRNQMRGERQNGNTPTPTPSLQSFEYMLRRDLRYQHDWRKFVLAALTNQCTDDVVLQLGDRNGPGLQKLRSILQCPFTIRARNSKDEYSFERIIVPLCHLLTSQEFQNSTHHLPLKLIYGAVHSEVLFFPRVLECMQKLFAGGTYQPELIEEEATSWNPKDGMKDILIPFAKLFLLLLTRVTDAAAQDEAPKQWQQLKQISSLLPHSQELEGLLNKSKTIIDSAREKERREEEAKRSAEEALSLQLALSLEMDEQIPIDIQQQPGPGHIHPNGPRHDNDHSDFRKINILPSQQEILCEIDPYLPMPGGSEHVAHPVDRYLDVQFRLLREDMLSQVRRGIQGFIKQNALKTLSKDDSKYMVKPTVGKERSARSNGVLLNVYRHVSVSAPIPSLFRGLCFKVEFDQLAHVKKMNKHQRKVFWTQQAGSRQLEVDSLVCIAVGMSIQDGHAKRILFATVARRDEEKNFLGDDRCSITLRLLDQGSSSMLIKQLSERVRESSTEENVMFQVRGHFFAGYEPVLRALQGHTVDSLPFTDVFVGDPDMNDMLPSYLSEDSVFDMRVLVKPEYKEAFRKPLAIPVGNFATLNKELHRLSKHLILDDTQIDAFSAAITRRVSLIQGPPGTGKTYIGIQIVRALLANSSGCYSNVWQKEAERVGPPARRDKPALHPILCICYTNHALDQFLEGLVSSGIDVKHIVRAGGRSKSEMLAARMLHNLSHEEKTKAEKHMFYELKNTAGELELRINRMVQQKKEPSADDLLEWLRDAFEDQYDSLIHGSGLAEDGFEMVNGSRGILATWLDVNSRDKKRQSAKSKKWSAPNTFNVYELLQQAEQKPKPKKRNAKDEKAGAVEVARPLDQILQCDDLWVLNMTERKILYNYWITEYQEMLAAELESAIKNYTECCSNMQQLKDAAQLRVLKQATIIGFTTSGCAKYQSLLKALQPRVVICEEAGEVLESHILASLTSGTEQLILIGDHLQLRPKVTEYTLSADSRNGFNLDVSLFERLVRKYQNIYKNTNLHELGLLCTLDTQRRMRPNIADLLRNSLYPSLKDSPEVAKYPPLLGFANSLWFFDHNWTENADLGQQSVTLNSYCNMKEAEMVVELVRYSIRQGYEPTQIAVLTPYVGQLMLLKRLLSEASMMLHIDEQDLLLLDAHGAADDSVDDNAEIDPNKNPQMGPQRVSLKQRVRLSTVDNFQGEEAELVIISTVRCNPKGRTGFLKISNRVNVMISRAKHGMILLGSSGTIKSCSTAPMFHAILESLDAKKSIGNFIPLQCQNHGEKIAVRSVQDFKELASDGGCSRPCGQRLNCGHTCRKLCHPDDRKHLSTQCREQCQRLIRKCQHPCPLLCYQPCGGCKVKVQLKLPCGHSVVVTCDQTDNPISCPVSVAVKMPLCNHQVTLPCGVVSQLLKECDLLKENPDSLQPDPDLALFACNQQCGGLLEGCNHQCRYKCGECTYESVMHYKKWTDIRDKHRGSCKSVCDRTLFCQHQCGAKTCHGSSDCPPCKQKCFIHCVHSKCSKECKSPCSPCVEDCTWKCTCPKKLACQMVCGGPCIRLPCDNRCTKMLSCGHQCPSVCGEPCPSKEYCRQCGNENQLSQLVDVIEMKPLAEHDPNESPLIVLQCGHAWTIETLDGQLGITKVYSQDAKGEWKDLLPAPTFEEADLKSLVCAACKKPISCVKRYGRLLNAALLQSTQKKFILEVTAAAQMAREKANEWSTQIETEAEEESIDWKKVDQLKQSITKLRSEYENKYKNYSTQYPLYKIYELELARWQKVATTDNNNFKKPNLIPGSSQPYIAILKTYLVLSTKLLQCHCSLWKDPDNNNKTTRHKGTDKKGKQPPSNNMDQLTEVESIYARCIEVIKELNAVCKESKSMKSAEECKLEEALTHWTYLAGVGSIKLPEGVKLDPTIRERQLAALERLEDALRNLPHTTPVMQLKEAAEDARKKLTQTTFYQEVTKKEKQAIFAAMGVDVGTGVGSYGGHWYTCPNGHIYCIGECGGAMQQSKCPECGATIGGGNHRLTQGNRAATEFLREVGGAAPDPNWQQQAQQHGLFD